MKKDEKGWKGIQVYGSFYNVNVPSDNIVCTCYIVL